MRIQISQKQYDRLFEGVEWGKNDDGSVNIHVNSKSDYASNKGEGNVDTRVFGTKDDILNAKKMTKSGNPNANSKSLTDYYNSRKSAIDFYNAVLQYVVNGRNGKFPKPNGVDSKTYTSVSSWFKNGFSDNRIIDACKKAIERISRTSSQYLSTYERVNAEDESSNKVARYLTGVVPYTNVKYISLFSMDDFNFSDAIKHGTARQNPLTDRLFGYDGDKDRPKDSFGNLKVLDVTYDNGIKPNLSQNFSLNGVSDGHFKQQYNVGDENYTSVGQFLDKSVQYAAYALKKEKYAPDVIVSAPSSSDFNKYYCTNLSRKLGVPYIDGFFERNMINVRFDDGKDVQTMAEKGFSPKDIMEFSNQVKAIAYKEIAYYIAKPIRDYVNSNKEMFSHIPLTKSSREKASIEMVISCLSKHAFKSATKLVKNNDSVSKHLLDEFTYGKITFTTKNYDIAYMLPYLVKIIGKRNLQLILEQVYQMVLKYSDMLSTKGYKLDLDSKRFKITQIKKIYRPFLRNVYVVADKYISQNGELFSSLKNSKFLIFDEDINSGATLKLAIDALRDKLPSCSDDNILCLVNAYSESGY